MDSQVPETNQIVNIPRRPKKEFSNEERNAILQFLLQKTAKGKLLRGAIQFAAREFNFNRMTISRIWKRAQGCYAAGKRCANVDSLKKKNCGRKKKDYSQNLIKMRDVPLNKRSTIRSLAYQINIPKSTLFRIFKSGESIKRVSSTVKPFLTDENKIERLEFCLSKLSCITGHFEDFYDYIHIDEKWFYLTQLKRSYYLCLDEEAPHRTCKSKRYITKVMFLAAVARPRFDSNKNCTFNGKIGIWPFVFQQEAKRRIDLKVHSKLNVWTLSPRKK